MKNKKETNEYIKSSKLSLKFSNKTKKQQLVAFINEYQRVVRFYVDVFWEMKKVPTLLQKDTIKPDTWMGSRCLQTAGKQASGIVRGTRKKQKQRLFVIGNLTEEKKFKQARKLQAIYDKTKMSKPDCKSVNPELDSRFVTFGSSKKQKSHFDKWLTLTTTGKIKKLHIPLKLTSHYNKLQNTGKQTNGVRIGKDSVTFMFKIQKKQVIKTKESIGIDVGKLTTATCSDRQISSKNNHGHDLNTIIKKMERQKKGSNAFARSQNHRTNYINWSINQLNLTSVKSVRLENIKNLRKGRRSSASLSRWTYTEIFKKIEDKCQQLDVPVVFVNPRYTSQRCSFCGWVCKKNRKGKLFNCVSCSNTADADYNASKNISLELQVLTKQQTLKGSNKTGFYWNLEEQEFIVPVDQKAIS